MDTFLFLKFLQQLAMPPASLAAALVVAVVFVLVGWHHLGRLVAFLGIAQTLVLSMTPVSDTLMVKLENDARLLAAKAPACCYDYIAVLGGAVSPAYPPGRPDPHVSDSADRVWHAARLFKQGVAPKVLLSGGMGPTFADDRLQSEAHAMRSLLVDFGVPAEAIVLDATSMNTIENIRNIRGIVGTGSVALVTSAYHMSRTMQLVQLARLNAQAFPTDWRIIPDLHTPGMSWIPSISALNDSTVAIKEHLALTFDSRGNTLKP